MSSDTDKKLLDIASGLSNSTTEETIVPEVITFSDIQDIVTNNYNRMLTNQDYLILNEIAGGKGLENIAGRYDVSQSYIKKVMRSTQGAEFLKEQSRQKSELALAISTTTVAEGLLKYQQLIDDLFKKGQNELALSYLFGKQSFSEVQASLHKQLSEEDNTDKNALSNLFATLMVDKG